MSLCLIVQRREIPTNLSFKIIHPTEIVLHKRFGFEEIIEERMNFY